MSYLEVCVPRTEGHGTRNNYAQSVEGRKEKGTRVPQRTKHGGRRTGPTSPPVITHYLINTFVFIRNGYVCEQTTTIETQGKRDANKKIRVSLWNL